ncbi:MAG: hypothetical protein LC751_09890 [Actinobacteria bacterium]|nr:hypothetical protein [Actinomycetota bacterium]
MKRAVSVCAGLEILDASPELVGECLCAWARLTTPHERPLLVHHDSRVRYGELLDLVPLPSLFFCRSRFHSETKMHADVSVSNLFPA